LFFLLSKTIGIMLLPTNFLIGVGLLGAILLATRLAWLGRKLLVVSIVLLAFCGFSPLGNWLLYPLEQRFPPWDAARGAPDGIVVLGGSIGLAALFLYLGTTSGATTGATQQILFGSIFSIDSSTIPLVAVFSAVAIAITAFIHRPLLLSSVSNDVAAARGVPLRVVGLSFMAALAVAVGLSSLTIGAILSTALLVGPAAVALRRTARLGVALIVACVIGVGVTWAGVLLAYDSYYWGTSRQGFPVSFFIVTLVFVLYLASGLRVRKR